LFVQMAAHLMGCRTAFLASGAPPAFLNDVLEFVDADAFVYERLQPRVTVLGDALAAAAAPLPVFCIGPGGLGPDLTEPPTVTSLPFDLGAITTEPVSLFQTGGTTRTPRLVIQGQRFFASVPRVSELYLIGDHDRIRHLNCSPIWHSGSQASAVM